MMAHNNQLIPLPAKGHSASLLTTQSDEFDSDRGRSIDSTSQSSPTC